MNVRLLQLKYKPLNLPPNTHISTYGRSYFVYKRGKFSFNDLFLLNTLDAYHWHRREHRWCKSVGIVLWEGDHKYFVNCLHTRTGRRNDRCNGELSRDLARFFLPPMHTPRITFYSLLRTCLSDGDFINIFKKMTWVFFCFLIANIAIILT